MQYSSLTLIVRSVFSVPVYHVDSVRPEQEWDWPGNAEQLEQKAKELSPTELEALATGSNYPNDWPKWGSYPELETFADQVYDGELTKSFATLRKLN